MFDRSKPVVGPTQTLLPSEGTRRVVTVQRKTLQEREKIWSFCNQFPTPGTYFTCARIGSQETEKEEELVHVLMIRSGRWGQQHPRQVLSRIFLDLSFILHPTFGKSLCSQSHGFSSSHVQMWVLDHKEGWASKNCYFQTMVLKTLGSPLDIKEIKQVNRKENQPWILMLKLKLQYFGHLMWRGDSLEKNLMLERLRAGGEGDDRGWDGWVGPLDRLNRHEFEQTLGDSEGQGSLVCCCAWDCKESDMS